MEYAKLKNLMKKANVHRREIEGYIVISNESFPKEYPLESRLYLFSSENNAFKNEKISNSIWASSLDGTDVGVKLSDYIGGDNGWKIEECGLVRYQVIETFERDTFVKGVYGCIADAQAAMRESLAEAVDYSVDALEEFLEDNDEVELNEYSAWANDAGPQDGNYDCIIVRLICMDDQTIWQKM